MERVQMSGGNLIVNGNFETNTGRVTPTGWQADRTGQVRVEDGDNAYSFSVYNQEINAAIRQTFATEVGKTYTLSLKGKVGVTPNDDAGIKVDILDAGSALVESKVFEVPGGKWSDHTLTFTATSTSTTLRLTDRIPSDVFSPVLVDDVSVVATPANLVKNGDFETGDAANWTLTGNGVVAAEYSGNDIFTVNSTGPGIQHGAIQQTINTVAGQTYTVKFDAWGGALASLNATASNGGANLAKLDIASMKVGPHGYELTFVATGAQTKLEFAGTALIHSKGVDHASVDNVVVEAADAPAGSDITGTPGNDYLMDTAADDIMLGGDGNDVFDLRQGGNDTVDGQGGDYNQIDLPGKSSDYTFSSPDSDGTVILTGPGGEMDNLRNIDGVYFYGDNKWASMGDLVVPAGETINGTPGNDYLLDTAGGDTMRGGDGNDVFDLRKGGNDIVYGEGGDYNQVDLPGASTDYKFTAEGYGWYRVDGPNGEVDTLKDIAGVYFYGDNKWSAITDLATPGPGTDITGTPGNDYLMDTAADDIMLGGDGNDVFDLRQGGNDTVDGQGGDYNQIDLPGKSSDYTFSSPDSDGTVILTGPGGEMDNLRNIDGVYFYGDNKWASMDDLVIPAGKTINGTPGNDYLLDTAGGDTMTGGDGNDVFDLSKGGNDVVYGGGDYNQVDLPGASTDYKFTATGYGWYRVDGPNGEVDTLKDIAGVYFYGDGKWSAIADLVAPAAGKVVEDGTGATSILGQTAMT
jgi:hypothetical protein